MKYTSITLRFRYILTSLNQTEMYLMVPHKLRQLQDLNKENEDFILLNIAQHSNKSSELRTPKCLPIMTSIETQNKSQKDSPNFLFILFSYRRNSFRLTTEVSRPITESNSGYPLISFTVVLRVMRDLSKQFIFENGKVSNE